MSADFQTKMQLWAAMKLDVILAQQQAFVSTLYDDYEFSKGTLERADQPLIRQILRRTHFRIFCALVEVQIHEWKWLCENLHTLFETDLSAAEIAVLHEESYELDDKGCACVKPQHLSMKKNFLFAAKMFARVFCCSRQADFAANGWECLRKVFKVRDRLMHPKLSKGVEVTDDEIDLLNKAAEWFVGETRALYESRDLAKVKERQAIKRLPESN